MDVLQSHKFPKSLLPGCNYNDNSPLNNLLNEYVQHASKKGRSNRIEISLPILGRNCSTEIAWYRTIKAERHKNKKWLKQQRNLARFLNKDIELVNHFSLQRVQMQEEVDENITD
jgi:hypothetical protein